MGVETSEPNLAEVEGVENENAGAEQEQKIRELTEQLDIIKRDGGPVLDVVQERANPAAGLVNPTSRMRLHLPVGYQLRDLLANEPDDETVNKIQTALAIFNEKQVTAEELADPNSTNDYSDDERGIQYMHANELHQAEQKQQRGGVAAAETLANRISLDRDRRIRKLLGL